MKQRGTALIVVVLLMWVVAMVAILETLIFTGTELSNRNLQIATQWAESTAISTAVPIREHLEEEVYRRIERDIQTHIQKQLEGMATGTPYLCQRMVTPTQALSEQPSICDPARLLDGLEGRSGQSIDDRSILRPTDPALLNTPEWREIEYETENSYDYNLSSVFVSREIRQEGVKRQEGVLGKPKIERYRWMVRADVVTRTYYNVTRGLIIYYDVVTNVYTYDDSTTGVLDCSTHERQRNFSIHLPIFMKCKNTAATPGDVLCQDFEICTPGTTCFKENCTTECLRNLAICENSNYVDQLCLTLKPGLGIFSVPSIISDDVYSSNGCVSQTTGRLNSQPAAGGGYTWNTVIKIVDIGNTFD